MSGLLLLNKPKGITSFGAVAKVKHLTGEKRIGHTGTLDPMASGVLPLLIGRATGLSSYLLSADKSYIATAKLGIETNTLDITGDITNRKDFCVSLVELKSVINSFLGGYMQTPPMFSAIKKQGVRLYKLAREGKEVQIEPRAVLIKEISLIDYNEKSGEFTFSATVSKGTYIRSLIRDIGKKLSTGAVMTALTRTATAGFNIESCVSLDDLTADNISQYIIPADKAVEHFNSVTVTDKQAVRFKNGGQLSLDRLKENSFSDGEVIRVYTSDKTFLGLGGVDTQKGMLVIKCIL